ncbi:hypothetical protein HNP47_000802 [Brevundimonas vesicularis]|uniref:DUF551 domain-containing protein n=1 Tax=Brevundimonas vesicularis TaxID=41276 RepID=A0A7W9L510_BREVE|nr:DUF551 domain-containing protein [Brevundimonas vesicularis]MBB5770833.1 hypothetical protein [Brevundimonas vesicularis]
MSNEAANDALRLPDRFVQLATDAAWARNVDKATAMMVDLDDLYALLLAAKAAPASPLPRGGWQDISTAPKDGTVVDLFYPERGRLTDATWGPTGWGRHEWRGSHTVRMIPSEKPTHWMPFPAAPTGDA